MNSHTLFWILIGLTACANAWAFMLLRAIKRETKETFTRMQRSASKWEEVKALLNERK